MKIPKRYMSSFFTLIHFSFPDFFQFQAKITELNLWYSKIDFTGKNKTELFQKKTSVEVITANKKNLGSSGSVDFNGLSTPSKRESELESKIAPLGSYIIQLTCHTKRKPSDVPFQLGPVPICFHTRFCLECLAHKWGYPNKPFTSWAIFRRPQRRVPGYHSSFN